MEYKLRGVIYCATGRKYIDEAIASADSLKKIHPDLPIALFTDKQFEFPSLFEEVHYLPQPKYSFIDKIYAYQNSPYQQTLFLDTDTIIVNNLEKGFDLLNRFDLCATPDYFSFQFSDPDVPDSFLEPNTAVVYFNKNENTKKLFDNWLNYYSEKLIENQELIKLNPHYKNDQPYLRHVLFLSDVRYYQLDYSYNYMVAFPAYIQAKQVVKVLHGRGEILQKSIKKHWGAYSGPRLLLRRENINPNTLILADVAKKSLSRLFTVFRAMLRF